MVLTGWVVPKRVLFFVLHRKAKKKHWKVGNDAKKHDFYHYFRVFFGNRFFIYCLESGSSTNKKQCELKKDVFGDPAHLIVNAMFLLFAFLVAHSPSCFVFE